MTLKEYITKGDRFAAKVGVEIVSVTENSAVTQLLVTKEHLNAGGVCQGGAIFTVADVALAAVVNTGLMLTLAIDSSIFCID